MNLRAKFPRHMSCRFGGNCTQMVMTSLFQLFSKLPASIAYWQQVYRALQY